MREKVSKKDIWDVYLAVATLFSNWSVILMHLLKELLIIE